MKLEDKIKKINEDFDKKEKTVLEEVKNERANAISKAIVDDVVANLPSMSYGNIFRIFENISGDIVKTKGGKNTLNGFISLVREDKNIHNAYLFMENVYSKSDANPMDVINGSLTIANESIDRKTNKESKKKLAKYVAEAINKIEPSKISEKVQINEETTKVNENIENLLYGRVSMQNVGAIAKSLNETVDFMSKHRNEVVEVENSESVFESCKQECMQTIDEAWEVSDSDVRLKLTEVKDKLSKKQFSEVTAENDIKYMKELIQTLK